MADDVRSVSASVSGLMPTPASPDEEEWSMDQAVLADILCDSARLLHERSGTVSRIETNAPVEYRLADGSRKIVKPDLYVALDVPQLSGGVFRVWVRKRTLDVVVEYTTEDSIASDRGDKLALYRDVLRVPEYFLFDVKAAAIEGWLEGYRLDGDVYQPIPPVVGPSGLVRFRSARLGLEIGSYQHPVTAEVELRAFLPGAASPLPTRKEAAALAALEAERAAREKAEHDQRKAEALLEQYRRRFGPLSPS